MTQQIELSGIGATNLGETLRQSLLRGRPLAVGIAAAFVSTEGLRQIGDVLRRCGDPECRLIAGVDHAITHPQALFAARVRGWKIRLGRSPGGIFHPKLIIAGKKFSSDGRMQQMCCVYVGSSNLTVGGFSSNVECGLIANDDGCLMSASQAFAELWNAYTPATDAELRHYAAIFAERARDRTVSELIDLGINDSRTVPAGPIELREQRPPSNPVIGPDFAIAAWTGLQSFTGEYRFQVEFPKGAGQVINQLIQSQVQPDGRIDVYCVDDEITRQMQYRFYLDNSMFRLNVQNNVPGVAWAREHKDGLAIVEKGPPGGAPLRLRLLRPGVDAREIVGRSAALGTWGRTPTRSYGWF